LRVDAAFLSAEGKNAEYTFGALVVQPEAPGGVKQDEPP
jgi:hypothetical protein